VNVTMWQFAGEHLEQGLIKMAIYVLFVVTCWQMTLLWPLPLQFRPRSLPYPLHTPLSRVPALTRLQGLAESITRKERGCTASTLYTHHQASLMMSRYTTLVPPLRLCIGPAREAGLSTDTWRGHVPPRKKERKKTLASLFPICT